MKFSLATLLTFGLIPLSISSVLALPTRTSLPVQYGISQAGQVVELSQDLLAQARANTLSHGSSSIMKRRHDHPASSSVPSHRQLKRSKLIERLLAPRASATTSPVAYPTCAASVDPIDPSQLAAVPGWDYTNHDTNSGHTSTAEACYNLCKSVSTCIGFVWWQNSTYTGNNCFPKIGPLDSTSWVNNDQTTTRGASTTYFITGNCASITPWAAGPKAVCCNTPGFTNPTCSSAPAAGYAAVNGFDYTGSDISNSRQISSSACLATCKASSTCIGFVWWTSTSASYTTSNCYLKKALTASTNWISSGQNTVKGSSIAYLISGGKCNQQTLLSTAAYQACCNT